MPNPEGDPKHIQVNDRDKDLFDFDLEAEPILQVLIGKAIELAQIEAIEDHEKKELTKHKSLFLQIKEAELIETQRMEAARKRRIDENERRSLQQRTYKSQKVMAEKKVLARRAAKDFLYLFKRDTLKVMVDEGTLRKPFDHSLQSTFIPQLYGQIQFDIATLSEHTDNLDNLLNFCMRAQSRSHRDAMIKEYKRREENKKELLRLQKEKEEQKRLRKEQRAAARERHRIGILLEKITATTIGVATQDEYMPGTTRIYDIRDPEAKKDGINVIGGLVGELIITFTCLLDYILANPQNQNFNFTVEAIENFLKDLLIQEGFVDGSLILHLS